MIHYAHQERTDDGVNRWTGCGEKQERENVRDSDEWKLCGWIDFEEVRAGMRIEEILRMG